VHSFADVAVRARFDSFPPSIRRELLALRHLVYETAAMTEGVGEIEEALKWGEPAYLTSESRSGSTIRLGWKKSNPARYAMYFHCRTNLITTFRAMFAEELRFEGNRAIVFEEGQPVPVEPLKACIAIALTYHAAKLRRPGRRTVAGATSE